MFGIKVETIDNPGWMVHIDLEDTELENKNFEKIQYDNGDKDWLLCFLKGKIFFGTGDSQKLGKILTIFKEWVETE